MPLELCKGALCCTNNAAGLGVGDESKLCVRHLEAMNVKIVAGLTEAQRKFYRDGGMGEITERLKAMLRFGWSAEPLPTGKRGRANQWKNRKGQHAFQNWCRRQRKPPKPKKVGPEPEPKPLTPQEKYLTSVTHLSFRVEEAETRRSAVPGKLDGVPKITEEPWKFQSGDAYDRALLEEKARIEKLNQRR
jgi:hypothetical protein